MEAHFLFRLLTGMMGLATGGMAAYVLLSIMRGSEKAMASFQLEPRKAENDFRIFLAGNIVMLAGFISYTMGGILDSELFLNTGRTVALMFAVFPITVFYRWGRRFR